MSAAIVHTPDIVLERAGTIPPRSSSARGYVNLDGDSPRGGYLRADNCQPIPFGMRPLMGRPSRSPQFLRCGRCSRSSCGATGATCGPDQVVKFERC
jgi:putative heme iron utilization protein